jgi:hypothetical protein
MVSGSSVSIKYGKEKSSKILPSKFFKFLIRDNFGENLPVITNAINV